MRYAKLQRIYSESKRISLECYQSDKNAKLSINMLKLSDKF
jgi:hypothetical protein